MAAPAAAVPAAVPAAAVPEVVAAPPTYAAYGRGRGKAKAKAKGRGKAKAKGRGRGAYGRAAAAAPAAAGAPGATGEVTETALVEIKQSRANSLRKKLINELGDKPIDQAISEAETTLKHVDAKIEEAQALETAQDEQAAAAQKEFEAARALVNEAIGEETAAAERMRIVNEKKAQAAAVIDTQRKEMMDAQRKLALLEVAAVTAQKTKMLNERKKAAAEAAEAAKKAWLETREREKAALEATKKALAEARAAAGVAPRKRGAEGAESPAKAAKTGSQQETLPATLVDGSAGQDVD